MQLSAAWLNRLWPHRYWVVAIYGCVLFLDRLDLTIVNVALPFLAAYFNVPVTETEWISLSFLLALALSIPLSGWLDDRFGAKRVFIYATAIYGFFSLISILSVNIWMLGMCRFCEGIGAGVLIPTGATLVYRSFEPEEYASVTSFIFMPTLLAPAVAPFVGGVLITYLSWRWIFCLAFPVCFIAVVLSALILHGSRAHKRLPFDWLGFALAVSFLSLLLYGLSELGKNGMALSSMLPLGFAVLSGVGLVIQELHCKHPLLPLQFFKKKLFVAANLMQLAFQICHFGSIFLLGMYLQIGLGMAPITSGIILGMQALGAFCTVRISVKLFNRYGATLPLSIGLIGLSLFTYSVLLVTGKDEIILAGILVFCRGLFTGLCGTPVQALSVIDFEKSALSRVNAIFNAGRQVSISLGTAFSSVLIAYGFRMYQIPVDAKVIGALFSQYVFLPAFLLAPAVAFIGVLIALRIPNHRIINKVHHHHK